MFETFLFDNWNDLLWIFLMSILIYPSLIVILRGFGKRTLTNVNMFDLIITIAYGNVLSSIIITHEISYTDGFTIMFIMTVLQVILSKLQMYSKTLKKLVKSKPVFLYYHGEFNEVAKNRHRLQRDDLLQVIRKKGIRSFADVTAITLEGDGTLAVMQKEDSIPDDVLEDVIWLDK
ncbi:DUF421 domain-containing protein [Aquibacillus rhizosphaerae]|uniref:DUF421 domain-containing protein n=1 Tax=Aquibacillus rhizosphaerae TaxID=3051431 RepID=A0ABT7L2A8_9BACI|nr:YetF domain-containing protein [Aquibacillus sp. LR5S19]MDL4839957.1 DUF421 domain-containing protein [Aquibacillus sp. LR5S19]